MTRQKCTIVALLLIIFASSFLWAYDYTNDYSITYSPNDDYLSAEWDIWWNQTIYQVANVQVQYIGPSPAPNRELVFEISQLSLPHPTDPTHFYLTEIPQGTGDVTNHFQLEFSAIIDKKNQIFNETGDAFPSAIRWNVSLNLKFQVINPRGPGLDEQYYGSYYGRYRLNIYVKEYTTGNQYILVPLSTLDMNMIAYYVESNYGDDPGGGDDFFSTLVLERFEVADNVPMPTGGQTLSVPVGSVIFMSNDTDPSHTFSYRVKPDVGLEYTFKEATQSATDIPYKVFVTNKTTPSSFEFTVPIPPESFQNAYWQDQIEINAHITNPHPYGIPYPAGNYSSTIRIELVTNF